MKKTNTIATTVGNEATLASQEKKVLEKLAITTMNEVRFIPLTNIAYLGSDNNYTTIYMDNRQKVLSSKNIGYYEHLLEPSNFFRIHNSYLVNLKKVNTYTRGKGGHVCLENGVQLEVSTRKKENLLKVLNLK